MLLALLSKRRQHMVASIPSSLALLRKKPSYSTHPYRVVSPNKAVKGQTETQLPVEQGLPVSALRRAPWEKLLSQRT